MKISSLGKPTERQQIILIILAGVALIAGSWAISTQILGSNKREINKLRKSIASAGYGNRSIKDLEDELDNEKVLLKQTRDQWKEVTERLGTYANQRALRRTNVTHIFYKVDLIRLRDTLTERSKDLGVELLPGDLGMDLDLADNEVARRKWLQLKAVERLVNLTLDGRIKRLYAISPLPPSTVSDGPDEFLEVYPVKVEFDVDFDDVYGLMQAMLEDNGVFAFDNIQVLAGPERDAPLRLFAVAKAMIFDPPKEG